MFSRLKTAAAETPITLVDAKRQIRVEEASTAYDDDLKRIIKSATRWAETFTGRALISQTWELTLNGFPKAELVLPRPPLIDVASINYIDRDGVDTLLPANQYRIIGKGANMACGVLEPAFGTCWPVPMSGRGVVTIEFTAGYGDAATDIPPDIQQALLLVVGRSNEHREDAVTGTISSKVPFDAEDLVDVYRVVNL